MEVKFRPRAVIISKPEKDRDYPAPTELLVMTTAVTDWGGAEGTSCRLCISSTAVC